MAATPSPLTSSVEETNGAKLSRLLIDGGTMVLRRVFDGFHPPANLVADLTANYVTLYNLKRKRVLHQSQWDLLFPPGGATPDSKTFDITLLFLLLTSICGLSPPLSGWHKPPPLSDTSFEANLARVKLYRNELYGHVTSTGVQTSVFNVKWQELSSVLVALGLNPAEVTKLKSAPCGEDYVSVVMEWVKSDEEIQTQLKEVLEIQQQARQIQEEDHRTLQDIQKAVEVVRQINQYTNEVVEEVLKTQQEQHQKHQEARQIQEGDQKTLRNTQQAVEEAHGAVFEVMKTQKEQCEALKKVKKTVENMAEKSHKDKEDEILLKLAKIDSLKVIEYHAERYQEGTRLSFFEKVEKWLDDRSSSNRVMVISGNAGMGKSVISAIVCKRMQDACKLSGSHFCQHDKARYRNGKIMLQSLACQLADFLPEYKNTLVKTLSRNLGEELDNMEAKDLFELLFEEPLSELKDPGKNVLMVIDGLDESEYQGRNELLDVIVNHFTKLPCWIRFLVTSRPEKNIADSLKSFNPLQLESNDEENLQDIRLLFEKRLSDVVQQDRKEVIISELVKKSEGLILYAFLLVNFNKENVSLLTIEQLDSTLPSGNPFIYQRYFQRLERELCKELKITEEKFLTFLSTLTAAREPLPLDFVTKIMLSGTRSLADRRKIKEVIACISAVLPVHGDCIHFFHKSVKDWLTDVSLYGQHDFTVDEKEGHQILSELCTDELDYIKQNGVGTEKLSGSAIYALRHGVRHILYLANDARACEVVTRKYVVDLELVYAKLCVHNAAAADDIVWIQRQKISQMLSDDIKLMLNTIMFLLRKHFITFTKYPQRFFQTMVNEGGSVLSPVASDVLENKYPEIPYMEFLHKKMQQGAVLARFKCSSQVVCFDVSPKFEYMVCECIDGTIHLWSLHSGKQVWERPVMVTKLYTSSSNVYRRFLPVSLVYRSVVFHPTADAVLPGVLSHAYAFDGSLEALFPESNCKFTVCSVSGDKTKMLTDCPDDAKCIIMWSLQNGSEIARTTRNEDVLSFAWTPGGMLLGISHSTGSISIVDAKDGFRTLAETIMPQVCGMIKFSPDCRSLFCLAAPPFQTLLCLNIMDMVLLQSSSCEVFDQSYTPRSETGFLLGDPISSAGPAFDFVFNKQTVLRSFSSRNYLDLLNVNELQKIDRENQVSREIRDIAFSLSGETVYVVGYAAGQTVRAWDVKSGELIGEKRMMLTRGGDRFQVNHNYLVTVKEGVLLTTYSGALELWNFDLSQCVRCWTNVNGITKMILISEERVACEAENKVIILDTTSEEIVSIMPTSHEYLLACNSKCQLLTYSIFPQSVRLLDGKTPLWENNMPVRFLCGIILSFGVFSLSEQFVVICQNGMLPSHQRMDVVDTLSGKTLHTVAEGSWILDCKFVSDEECIVSSEKVSEGYCLQLFNVQSGDLLSVIDLERRVACLAACPRKRLLATGQSDTKHRFKLIQVHLPQDKDNRKSRSMTNTPEIEMSSENKRTADSQDVTVSKPATDTPQKRSGESPSGSDTKRPKLAADPHTDLIIKEGTPENIDLERLAQKIPDHWKKLGRRLLEDDEEALSAIHKENEECCEKAYKMLLKWKRAKGSGASYRVLHDALCHDLVNRQDLAEKFCLEGHG